MSVRSNTSGVNSIVSSPYLADVLDQPRALSALLDSAPSIAAVPDRIGLIGRPRVLVSGMGSSHLAGLRIWTTLVRMGVPAWWVETTQLLDLVDGIVEPNTLLWLTSQSGESAETVAVLERVADQDVHIVGVTNNPVSSLGRAAHTRIDLLAGDEATVSTKSYVNSLAVGRLVSAQLVGTANDAVLSLRATADAMATYLATLDDGLAALDDFAVGRHLILTGRGLGAASAEAAGLILKEAAKVPVEGMSASALRHGPIELAGPGLAVVFFDHGDQPHRDQNRRLASELSAAGTQIAWVATDVEAGVRLLPAPTVAGIDGPIRDALAFQTLSFQLARRSGVTAGAFTFASKVTGVL